MPTLNRVLPDGALGAVVYCAPNRRRSDRYPSWFTSIQFPNTVVTQTHTTERQARGFLGLPGGSDDHHYLPLDGSGYEEVEP